MSLMRPFERPSRGAADTLEITHRKLGVAINSLSSGSILLRGSAPCRVLATHKQCLRAW